MLRRAMSTAARPIFGRIESKLTAGLAPSSLKIKDESFMHAGHSGNPSGDPDAETHFKVEIVSPKFEGKMPVARHRMVYELLDQEIKDGVHALSLKTKTPAEAEKAKTARPL
jgi:stress-induced morphogen